MSANLLEEITTNVAGLPPEKQREVLAFVQFIAKKRRSNLAAAKKFARLFSASRLDCHL